MVYRINVIRLNAGVLIKFFMIRVWHLFEGGVYRWGALKSTSGSTPVATSTPAQGRH